MPYLTKERKAFFNEFLPVGIFYDGSKSGELNYCLTSLCLTYLEGKAESYQTYNDIVGALESCKLEFYRRMVAEYENKKIKENGDVFE